MTLLRTIYSLLTFVYMGTSTFAFAEQQRVTFTEKQFKHCKLLAGLISVEKFSHQSAKAKGEPHYSEHSRLYEEGDKLTKNIEAIKKRLDAYSNPVPDSEWDAYSELWLEYSVLKARRAELYKQGDIKYTDYEKFKPEINKRNKSLQVAYGKYDQSNCTKAISTKNSIIDKHCPASSKNTFCKSWH